MKNSDNRECVDACNKLLRGELAAIDIYHQAIEKFDSPEERSVLQEIMADHSHNADVLRQHIVAMGGTPSASSGAWGAFAQAVAGTAKLLGESPALQALRAGENHGISEYKDALQDRDVMLDIKQEITQELLPVLDEHVHMLDRLAA